MSDDKEMKIPAGKTRNNKGKIFKKYGKHAHEIAAELGVPETAVRYWMLKYKWEPGQPPPPARQYAKNTEQIAKEAKEMGVSTATIYMWRKKHGWKTGQPRPVIRQGRPPKTAESAS